MHDEERLDEAERRSLALLTGRCPAVGAARSLARDFLGLMREKRPQGFEGWVTAVEASGLENLKTLAASLVREGKALLESLESPYSNGPVEGSVNKIKTIKRQMYGRASFGLLRNQVLMAT